MSYDRVLLGKDDGSFEGYRIPGEFGNLFGIDTGDFNNDGITDLIGYIRYEGDFTSGTYEPIETLIGKGDGTFNPPQISQIILETDKLNLNFLCSALVSHNFSYIGNLDSDGLPDIVLPCFYDPSNKMNMIGIMSGTNEGKFIPEGFLKVSELFPMVITGADLNNSGGDDLIIVVGTLNINIPPPVIWSPINIQSPSSDDTKTTIIFINNGDMTFKYNGEYKGIYVHSRDFNNDGFPDLIGRDGPELNLLINNGYGTFNKVNLINYTNGYILTIIPEDFDSDNLIDVGFIVIDYETKDYFAGVMFNKGNNAFQQSKNLYKLDKKINAYLVRNGDFNVDELLDIVIPYGEIHQKYDKFQILLGKGENGFRDGGEYSVGHEIEDMVVWDFNSDGFQDIGVAAYSYDEDNEYYDIVSIFLAKDR